MNAIGILNFTIKEYVPWHKCYSDGIQNVLAHEDLQVIVSFQNLLSWMNERGWYISSIFYMPTY